MFSSNISLCISPPCPVKKFFYRCDKIFHVEEVLDYYTTYEDYAIVLVSGCESRFYLYNYNETKLLKTLTIDLPNQHKTGGQSAQRFGRIRDEKIRNYTRKIIELIKIYYISDGIFKCKGLIIAGPGELKYDMINDETFKPLKADKIITTAEINNTTILQVVNQIDYNSDERKILDKLNDQINHPDNIDLLEFNQDEIIKLLEAGELKEVYLSSSSPLKEYILSIQTKTIIHTIQDLVFCKTYGLVGIRYFRSFPDVEIEDDSFKEFI